jgi:hypothetical protein
MSRRFFLVYFSFSYETQLLVYADDVNLLGDNIDVIEKNKEVDLEVNAEEIKYLCMLLSRHQNACQKHSIKIASRSFENI